ncbi:hypothetical protein J437_LFUL006405 [Ladona fulva]|uniref:PiggyBac transposable element-derived protein domain-containing protein n=1 Tax=Ladona fulva TaxID=123851 RepID=A0A8K0NYE1_LADFU|nr:hypothetical protein J437_LFUL006405 [Ladona fulva]
MFTTGTLRPSRKGNPPNVISKKLKKGEVYSEFTEEGLCVSKWKDRRDILTISTEFNGDIIPVTNRRGEESEKPCVEEAYVPAQATNKGRTRRASAEEDTRATRSVRSRVDGGGATIESRGGERAAEGAMSGRKKKTKKVMAVAKRARMATGRHGDSSSTAAAWFLPLCMAAGCSPAYINN